MTADDDLGPWAPLDPVEVHALMADYGRPWWIAGGWALDLALGRQTREHGDVDVAVLRSDQLAVQSHLRGWELHLANVVLTPWVAGELAPPDTCDVWCRAEGSTSWAFQLMFDPGTDETWVSRRNTMLTRPLSLAVRRTGDDIPYLAPELQLLMKAKRCEAKDQADFDVVVGAGILDAEARSWLRSALERTQPGHAWVDALA